MTVCNNPVMCEHGFTGKCANGELNCCRHCDKAKECLSHYTSQDGYLCVYIHDEKDLEQECPFEKII
jgi:hypothetical protein